MADVTTTRLNSHDEEFKTVWKKIDHVEIVLEEKVASKTFMWIIGLLVTVLIGMFTYVANQISDQRKENLGNFATIDKNMSLVQSDISSVKGKLEPYNIEFKP